MIVLHGAWPATQSKDWLQAGLGHLNRLRIEYVNDDQFLHFIIKSTVV
jgi:hypothetical protein